MADITISVAKMRCQIRAIDKKGNLDNVNNQIQAIENGFHVNCLLGDINDSIEILKEKPELFKKLRLVLNKESYDIIY